MVMQKYLNIFILNKVVGEYRIRIDYEFKNIEIHKGTKFVCLRNFKSCEGKIWTKILEELEEDKAKEGDN